MIDLHISTCNIFKECY